MKTGECGKCEYVTVNRYVEMWYVSMWINMWQCETSIMWIQIQI